MTTVEDLAPLVSFHAVTRYVQRVLGVEVVIGADEWPADTHRGVYEARRHADTVGLTIDAVRRMILTPAVAVAAAMKMSSVSTREFQAVLQDGVVVTINAPRGPTKRLRVLSRREGKQHAQRHHRQARRRPSW